MSRHFYKWITGCLCASFFIACQQSGEEKAVAQTPKKLEMHQDSELALLMRKMYAQNEVIRKTLAAGRLPETFPEDFYRIHEAKATKKVLHDQTTFEAMATTYVETMKRLKSSQDPAEAKLIFNEAITTCASCHQVYCRGPLKKIKRLKLPVE